MHDHRAGAGAVTTGREAHIAVIDLNGRVAGLQRRPGASQAWRRQADGPAQFPDGRLPGARAQVDPRPMQSDLRSAAGDAARAADVVTPKHSARRHPALAEETRQRLPAPHQQTAIHLLEALPLRHLHTRPKGQSEGDPQKRGSNTDALAGLCAVLR